MTDALKTASDIALELIVIAAVLSVPLLLFRGWRAARRYQLVVTELVNSTADEQLGAATRGLTQLARQRIDAEVRLVARRREELHAALGATRGERSSRTTERVQQRLDDSLGELVSVARDVAPKPTQPAVQLLSTLLARPRGLIVAGILQSRGRRDAARLGVSLDVLQVDGNRSLASQTFWESADAPPPAEAGALSPNERIIELLRPAARWAAIRLVVQSVFPRGARGEEAGLDRLLSGVLYAQSAAGFAAHAEAFRRRAAEELVEAAERLPEAPLPLAALADTLDRLAAASPDRSATLYAQAHRQYARALAAMERQQPPQPALIARYRVREATSWLASGRDEPRHRALERLAGQRLPAEDTAAADLYDAACLYALAAEAADDGAPLRETALGLLARSLAKDRRLAEQARRDPHLLSLRDDVAALAGTPS